MSDFATTEIGGSPKSAWEYRVIYLDDGITNPEFYCPYCEVRLSGRLIHTKGEISKAPHFAATYERHQHGCDGYPILTDQEQNQNTNSSFQKTTMLYPEAFIDRPPKIEVVKVINPDINSKLTTEQVNFRRKNQDYLGTAQATTYLLQAIVEAKNSALFNLYNQAEKEGLNPDKRKDLINKSLKALPLKLDYKTNYSNGFRTPRFINNSNRYIYWGEGRVSVNNDKLIIKSNTDGTMSNNQGEFLIIIDSKEITNDNSPKSHIKLIEKLNNASTKNETIKWYAFGIPKFTNDVFELTVFSCDYLYIK